MIPAAERIWGRPGVLGSAAVLGLTDMDALTYSMARFGRETGSVALAARAIAIGVLSNTIVKLAITLGVGSPAHRLARPRRARARDCGGGVVAGAVTMLWPQMNADVGRSEAGDQSSVAGRSSASSSASHSASQLASMMFSEHPTVLHRSAARADSMMTLGFAAVPRCSSTIRTL